MHDGWKHRWELFLNREASAAEIVDEAIREHSTRVTNILGAWLDPASSLRPIYERMLQFHVKARDELVKLSETGANPAILIGLANPPLTSLFAGDEVDPGASEFETIRPPEYWKQRVAKLERASDDLAEFMKTRIYRAAEKGQFTPFELRLSPFARICKEVQATKLAIDSLVKAIRSGHLDSGARKLTYSTPYVFLETHNIDPDLPLVEEREQLPGDPFPLAWWRRTKPIGARGPKPNSPRREQGDGPAYALWKYLSVRTGKPRLASVAHLIMCAGWESPVQSGINDSAVETMRKRIEKLRRNPEVTLSSGDRITALEVDFESREYLDYGGFLTHPLSKLVVEPERKK